MRGTNASDKKRLKKILAVGLALLMMVVIVPVWASAAEEEEVTTAPPTADVSDELLAEEGGTDTEETDMGDEAAEDETPEDETSEELDGQQDEDAAADITESQADEDEADETELAEQDESEYGLEDNALEIELLDIEYLALPQTAEEVAELVAEFPYGGSDAEQRDFLESLPKWETALENEWLPKGWVQAEKGTQAQGFYWALTPDSQNFAFIFDANSLKSFLTLAVSGAPKTGLLVSDIQLDEGITTSKNYAGHVLDGNNYTVYAPESGRHLTLTLSNYSDLTFKDITFNGLDRAGGISITGYTGALSSQIVMENVTVQNCVEAGTGTVYLAHLKGTVTDSNFVSNTALEGGGLYITGRGALAFENCQIEENKARNGGGIYINYVTSASATQATATFTNCSINSNSSKDGTQAFGIGMYVNNSYGSVIVTNSSINSNYMQGQGYGVGLYVKNTNSLTISGTEINDNFGEGNAYGGAFFVDKGKFILRDSFVQNNQTKLYFGGGALYNRTYTTITGTITNTKFIGNFTRDRGDSAGSTNGGGALGIISLSDPGSMANPRTATTKVEIDGCEFIANRAAPSTEHAYGGAINIATMSTYDDVIIRNTNFERNSAAEGGALFVLSIDMKRFDSNGIQPGYYPLDKVKLVNCEFKYNVATVAGGAIGTEMMGWMASQVNYYNAIKGTNVSFTDNMAPTGHQLPTDSQAYPILAYAVERQFGVNIDTPNSDPSRLPLTSPFAVNHNNKYYRSPYNNYDIAQNYNSTIVTSGMYKFTYHANGADTFSGQPSFTFNLMPERNVLLLAPDDGSMGFTMTGYNFVEWNTAYDGSGNSYQPGELMYITAADFDSSSKELVLYAIWEYNPGAFTVTYKNEQANETYTDPVPSLVTLQTVLGIQDTGFTIPDGYAFGGWKDNAGNTFAAGERFQYDYSTMGANYTLTAQWVEKPDFSLYLRYVDSEGNTLGNDALAQNPREVYAGENEILVIADNLATLNGYKAMYYTIEGQSTKLSLADDAFTMTAGRDGTVLLVYCASTMLDIKVPTAIEFFAMSANGMDVYSPVYSFGNQSDLPAEVSFTGLYTDDAELEGLQLGTDGIAFVEDAVNPYEMHLSLEPDANTANNSFEQRFAGTNGKPGILPNSPYQNAVVAKLTGQAIQGAGNSGLAAFTIGGQYAGPYELNLRTPKVALQFHVSLVNADYEW